MQERRNHCVGAFGHLVSIDSGWTFTAQEWEHHSVGAGPVLCRSVKIIVWKLDLYCARV